MNTDVKPAIPAITDPRAIRRKTRSNQQQFWERLGVTQSGGCRYESGRRMPKPLRLLMGMSHLTISEAVTTFAALRGKRLNAKQRRMISQVLK